MKKWLVLFLLFFPLHQSLQAQQGAQRVSLAEVFQQLKDQKNIDISHDPELIKGFSVSDIDLQTDITTIFRALSAQVPFEFEIVEDNYGVVRTRPVTLSIKVVEQNSGESIPGVYVKKNGQYAQKVSDPTGIIEINLEWQKEDVLTFEFLGYAPQDIRIVDLLRSPDKVVALKEGTTLLNELVIESYIGNGISAFQRNHSLNIKTEDLGVLPGDTNKDLLVSLRALPGISTVTGRAGELRVRGGTPDQTLVLFDNIPIYHKGYYYGTISPFSTDIVDEVKVYRSGFTPRLGGRVGGAIEINSAREVPKEVKAGLGTSSVFGSGYLKLPIIKDKLGVTLSARSSYNFNWQAPIEKEFEEMVVVGSVFDFQSENPGVTLDPLDFKFRDINGNIIFQPNKDHQLMFNFLSIDNDNEIDLTDTNRRIDQEIRSILDNRGTNFTWKGTFGNWSNELFITNAEYQYSITDDERRLNGRPSLSRTWDNVLNTTKLGNIFRYQQPSNGITYSAGYELTQLRARFDQTAARFRGMMMPPMRTSSGTDQKGTIHSVFGNFYVPEWNNFMLDLGLRANFYGRPDFANLEPRLFVNYSVNDQLTLKSSAGIYSQYLTRNLFFELGDLPIEKLVWELVVSREGVITSEQYLIGASYQAKEWLFDVDAYYKQVAGVTTNAGNSPQTGLPRKLIGDLYSKGVDFLIRRKIGNLNLWVNYTLAQVDLRFPRLKTEDFPANYDQRHNVNLTATYQKGPWRASLGWLYASGIPDYTNDDFFPATIGFDEELPPPTPVGDIPRFGAIHQLDGSVAYVHQPDNKKVKFTVGLSVLNIYDRENVLETLGLNQSGPGQQNNTIVNRATIGFAPDLMLRIEW